MSLGRSLKNSEVQIFSDTGLQRETSPQNFTWRYFIAYNPGHTIGQHHNDRLKWAIMGEVPENIGYAFPSR